ncbi:MarR family winged helix-turn-helix transcriptional regulator [Peribacillus frigoritolerans]|uniref:MarR family winged helix-turn-helix transcriptional regulator n=1 Tax=Peribacillus frigoritolerans TaxID=450367 RepID=UPI0007BEFB62|nr:MarR family winged helix-turn-helix transcriptional regulator [Peribacillus frigoritolerans]USK67241.1 MarR family winged helix-turn-helix transcriptional regulator [Peribacillus frigoritolerans]
MENENLRGLFQLLTRRFGLLNKNCCNADGIEISLVQSHILYEINRQKKASIQQIAETLGTDITTFSRQIQSLIKLNLVTKTPDAEDRRISILSLTDEGVKINQTIDQQMNDYLNEIFKTMNEFEKESVVRSLTLLNDRMLKSSVCCTTPWG